MPSGTVGLRGTMGQPGGQTATESLTGTGRSRARTVGWGAAVGLAVVLLLVGIGGGYFLYSAVNPKSSTSSIQITETGSSLLYPLIKNYWAPNYTAYDPNVLVSAASTGSGTGQSNAENGLVNMGGSDGYLSNASVTNLINVPVAISSQLVYYNLPGVTGHLNLNGTVLAMIYEGTITSWNDSMILAAQSSTQDSEINALASQTIYVIKRADSSGDTFLFSSFCFMAYSGWTYGYSTSALSSLSGTNVVAATGNSGMVTAVKGQVGAIAYIGISYEASLTGVSGVNYAALGNTRSLSAAGGVDPANYVLPGIANISADANLGLTHLQYDQYGLAVSLILGGSPTGAIALVKGGGGTDPAPSTHPYPIVNLEYILIKTGPTGSTVTAAALHATVQFLEWAVSKGNYGAGGATSAYLTAVNFVPLTPAVIGYVMTELASVQA